MKTSLIYFVHGTTYDNASKKCSGWKQVELNELGKKLIKKIGEKLVIGNQDGNIILIKRTNFCSLFSFFSYIYND